MTKTRTGWLLATASVLALAGATGAQAQDPMPVKDIFDSKFVGVNGGWTWADGDLSRDAVASFNPFDGLSSAAGPSFFRGLDGFKDGVNIDGGAIGGQLGVNHRTESNPNVVVGAELSAMWLMDNDHKSAYSANFDAGSSCGANTCFKASFNEEIDLELDVQASARLRLGRTWGREQQIHTYVTGGISALWYDLKVKGNRHACELQTGTPNCTNSQGDVVAEAGAFSKGGVMFGPSLGIGTELAFGDRKQWAFGAEFLAEFFNDEYLPAFRFDQGTVITGELDDFRVYKLRVRLSRAF